MRSGKLVTFIDSEKMMYTAEIEWNLCSSQSIKLLEQQPYNLPDFWLSENRFVEISNWT